MVQKMYREFAENEVKPLAKKVDAKEYFPKETVEKMGKLGMMGIYFPTEVGGAGGDVLSYVMGVEELSKAVSYTHLDVYKRQGELEDQTADIAQHADDGGVHDLAVDKAAEHFVCVLHRCV